MNTPPSILTKYSRRKYLRHNRISWVDIYRDSDFPCNRGRREKEKENRDDVSIYRIRIVVGKLRTAGTHPAVDEFNRCDAGQQFITR